jgi:mannosyl-3-phosphoglycerate phosphatase
MYRRFKAPRLPVLVFTDLDGTLLDHDNYSFAAAQPALSRLNELNIPVILNTSKTLAELEWLTEALNNPHPFIVENGSALCVPKGYFASLPGATLVHGYKVIRMAPEYATVLQLLNQLRNELEVGFRGFHDMTADEVATETGLSAEDATRARQRLCSEPLVWEDSPEAFARFESALEHRGFSLTRGGRFWHVIARQSKAQAMKKMLALYQTDTGKRFTTIAAGDSPNDMGMLSSADIAVIVQQPDGRYLDVEGTVRTLRTEAAGPAGWNRSIQDLIDELTHVHPQHSATPSHGS